MKKAYQKLINIMTSKGSVNTDKWLTLNEVIELVGFSRSHIFALRKKGKFPEPKKLSPRKIVWKESVIIAFMNQ